ncbi:MAG: MFS transporter [Gaiellales bacterium]
MSPAAAARARTLVPPLGPRAWRLLAGVLLFEIGTGMTLPLLIVYLHQARHLSLTSAGLALSAMGAAGLVGTVAAGTSADRLGAGRTAVGGLLLAAVGTAGFLVVNGPVSAIVAAGLQGAGFAVTWIGMFPLLIRAVSPGLRSEVLGANYAVTNVGLGIGSSLAGFLLAFSPGTFAPLFVVDTASYLLFAVLLVAFGEVGGATTTHEERSGGGYGSVARDTRLLVATAINLLLVVAGYSQLLAAFPAWATGPAGAGQSVVGFAFAANTWAVALAQFPVLVLARRHRRTRAVAVCGLLFAACWLIVLAAGQASIAWVTAAGLMLGAAVFGVGETFLSPSLPAIVNDLTSEQTRGRYVAFYSLSWQAGPMIGPAIAGAAIGAGQGGPLLISLAAACALAVPAALAYERILPAAANRPAEAGAGAAPP